MAARRALVGGDSSVFAELINTDQLEVSGVGLISSGSSDLLLEGASGVVQVSGETRLESDPSLRLAQHSGDPTHVADKGFLYAKDVSGVTELFYMDSDGATTGTVVQITSGGAVSSVGGWTDDGTIVRLTTSTDTVAVGTASMSGAEKIRVVGGALFEIDDDDPLAFKVTQGSDDYMVVDTADGTEQIDFGNTTTNPNYLLLGSGYLRVDGSIHGPDNGTGIVVGHAGTGASEGSALRVVNLSNTERDYLSDEAGMIVWSTTDSQLQYNDGADWQPVPLPTSGGGWTDDGTIVRLTTSSDSVVVGAASLYGSEKFRVVGETYLQGNLNFEPAIGTDAYITAPQATGSGTNGIDINIVAAKGADDATVPGQGGDGVLKSGEGGNSAGAVKAGIGGAAQVKAGLGGDNPDTGDGGDGGTLWLSGGTGKAPTGTGAQGIGGNCSVRGGSGNPHGQVSIGQAQTSQINMGATGVPTVFAGEAQLETDALLRMAERVGDPTHVANKGFLYTKDIGGISELFWADSDGASTQQVVQITTNGVVNASSVAGGGWSQSTSIVHLTTSSNTVVVGASAMSASEKLRVVGSSLFEVADNDGLAFEVVQGSDDYILVDTTNTAEQLILGNTTVADLLVALVGNEVAIGAPGNPTDVTITIDDDSTPFTVKEGTNEYIGIDTSNGAEFLVLGNSTVAALQTALLGNKVSIGSGANPSQVAMDVPDNDPDAFRVLGGGNPYLDIDTTTGSESVTFGNATDDPDFSFAGGGTVSVAGPTVLNADVTLGDNVADDIAVVGSVSTNVRFADSVTDPTIAPVDRSSLGSPKSLYLRGQLMSADGQTAGGVYAIGGEASGGGGQAIGGEARLVGGVVSGSPTTGTGGDAYVKGGSVTGSPTTANGGDVYVQGGNGATVDGRVFIGNQDTLDVNLGGLGVDTQVSGILRGPNNGQGMVVGIAGNTDPSGSTIQIVSMTTTQRDNLSEQPGMLVYNSTAGELQGYVGSAWVDLGAGGGYWTQAAGALYPTTGTDDVVIGATAMVGTERLRVVGDVRLEGDITLTKAAGTIIRPIQNASAGGAGYELDMLAGEGGDNAAGNAGAGGSIGAYAGAGGEASGALNEGGAGGVAYLGGGVGGSATGTGDGGNGGDAYVTGGFGQISTGGGGQGLGGSVYLTGGQGGTSGSVYVGTTQTFRVEIGAASIWTHINGPSLIADDIQFSGSTNVYAVQTASAGALGYQLALASGEGGDNAAGAGGAGGELELKAGTGGDTSAVLVDGGAGGIANLTAGTGGQSSSTGDGGNGGDVTIGGGWGGTSTGGGATGLGGDAYINGGNGSTNGRVYVGTVGTFRVEIAASNIETFVHGGFYLDSSAAQSFLDITDGGSTPVAAATHGRLRYNETDEELEISRGGAAYIPINAPTSDLQTSTTLTTTTSATDVAMASMTITPGAGTYMVWYSGNHAASLKGAVAAVSIYAAGTLDVDSVRTMQIGGNNYAYQLGTQGRVQVAAGQAIEIRWRTSGGTASVTQRSIMITRVTQ